MARDHRGGPDLRSRREVLHAGLCVAAGAVAPSVLGASDPHSERILVIVELSGGNDGLDTLLPHGDDAWHRARPALRRSARQAHRLDHYVAFHPALGAWKRMWDEGLIAVVQGCGSPHLSRSHFSSIQVWHTALPDAASASGWLGRLAEAAWPDQPATLVSVGTLASPAVRSARRSDLLVSDPERPVRPSHGGATDRARRAHDALRDYRTPVDYGAGPLAVDLRRVAALVAAGFPARAYTTAVGGFDTHASQASGRPHLLSDVGRALRAFHQDVQRLGRGGDVATMIFSEFGRRLEENASLGTDHGTAGPMLVMGEAVEPGFYGEHPSLTDLDESGDLKTTTDFRRVYATMVDEWLGHRDVATILRGRFEPLRIFASAASWKSS